MGKLKDGFGLFGKDKDKTKTEAAAEGEKTGEKKERSKVFGIF